MGTVYRRFSTKEELVEALFMDRLDAVAAIADQALAAPDPWSGSAMTRNRRRRGRSPNSELLNEFTIAPLSGAGIIKPEARSARIFASLERAATQW